MRPRLRNLRLAFLLVGCAGTMLGCMDPGGGEDDGGHDGAAECCNGARDGNVDIPTETRSQGDADAADATVARDSAAPDRDTSADDRVEPPNDAHADAPVGNDGPPVKDDAATDATHDADGANAEDVVPDRDAGNTTGADVSPDLSIDGDA